MLPEALRGRTYYEPTGRGFEEKLRERVAALRKRLRKGAS
jgi:replication-associated recombination protein RarA